MVSACYTYYLGDEVAFYVELEISIEEYHNDDNTGGLLLDTSDMDENLLEVIINEDEPVLGDGHIKEAVIDRDDEDEPFYDEKEPEVDSPLSGGFFKAAFNLESQEKNFRAVVQLLPKKRPSLETGVP